MNERTRKILLRLAAVGVVFPAVWPCVVTFTNVIWLDFDPRRSPLAPVVTSFGPAGLASLHALAVMIAAAAIAVAVRCGAVIRWGSCALFGVGLLACLYHLGGTYESRIAAGGYLAAGSLALAAAHLGQHEIARRWMVAILAAVLIPTAIEAAWYVMVEHPMTLRIYEQFEQQNVESRGWQLGSSQHDLFRRRLASPDAIGRFSLSNVLGSVSVGLTLLATGLVVGMWRRNTAGWWKLLGIVVVVAGLMAIGLTRSKGAAMALIAGYGLLATAAVVVRRKSWAHLAPMVAIGLIIAAIAAVMVRGWMGPPPPEVGMAGERSLLFRYQYWTAAERMLFSEPPASWLVGVGPGEFQRGYVLTKDPMSPEEVTSAHNVFVDLIAGLGIGGWVWSAMLLLWLWQAGAAVARPGGQSPPHDLPYRIHIYSMALLALLLFVPSAILERQTMIFETSLLWLAKVVLFTAAAVVLSLAGWTDRQWTRVGLFAAAGAVLVHNQIEMSFFHPPSMMVMWLIVGLAAGGLAASHGESIESMPRAAWAPVTVLGGCAFIMLIGYATPLQRHQHYMEQAADALRSDAVTRALGELDAAADEIASDPLTLRWQVQLRMESAYSAAVVGYQDKVESHLDEALAAIDRARRAGLRGPMPAILTAQVQVAGAQMLGETRRITRAIDAYEQAIERGPQSLTAHVALGDLLFEIGQRSEAAEVYRKALQISEQSYLDTDRQLDEDDLERVRSRVDQVEAQP